jgi:succinyl-CoA synthetase beta subunit
MHIHEFLAKELLSRRGVSIAAGRVAGSAADVEKLVRGMAPGRYVVKAQVQAGDRLASGGIRFVDDASQARIAAAAMLGKPLITRQTGPRGERVRWVYVEQAVTAIANLYVAVALDRAAGEIVVLGRATPVVDGEPTVIGDGGALRRLPVRIVDNQPVADFDDLARRIAPAGDDAEKLAALLRLLAAALIELDATLIEINPLAYTGDGRYVALDAKMTIDDNALFRHPDIGAWRDAVLQDDGDPGELASDRHNINYIGMDGDIGLVVNGAGLALATLDMLKDAGGRPANFMDVRTTATSLDVAFGFDLLLANPALRAVLLNVHGGGMQRCDTIVEGLAISMRRSDRRPPLVARLAGNNADFARDRLKAFGIQYTEGATIAEAVDRVVALGQASSGKVVLPIFAKNDA